MKNTTVSGGADDLLLGSREPRAYDHRLFVVVFFLSAIVIISVIVATVIWSRNGGGKKAEGSLIDLSSLFIKGDSVPDPANPCIVVQAHLEATRRGMYDEAYRFLSKDLQSKVSLEDFKKNAQDNRLLFSEIKGYEFPGYAEVDGSADVIGVINYDLGGASRVEARLVAEDGDWKISEINLVYQ